MAIEITVPRQGWSMEEGTFIEWRKTDGDKVRPGDALYVLESEKATEEIESLDAGILRIPPDGPQPGEKVKVGQLLAYLTAEGEAAPLSVRQQAPQATAAASESRTVLQTVSKVAATGTGDKPAISPRARRVAAEMSIDWSGVKGSGRNGRIRERDIRTATATRGSDRLIPHTTIRRTLAGRMVAGVTQAAPVTLVTKADATNLVNLYQQFKTAIAADATPGYTDMILKLTAAALRQHPLLQAQWRDDGLFVPERIDIAIAVDTDAGLLAPAIRNVDRLTLREVTAHSRTLVSAARAGQLTAEQMRDATFTVTNLGSFGIDAFTPIINLPQCAVLGIGRIVREPAVVSDQIMPRDMTTLSLTFDHRIVDGAPAARFLQTLSAYIEQPAPWLIP